MYTVQINGLTFGIDTDDWKNNSADADKCADMMAKRLARLSKKVIAKAHAVMMADQTGENANDIGNDWANTDKNPEFWAVKEIGPACKSSVMRKWATQPDTGHNADFYAVANA